MKKLNVLWGLQDSSVILSCGPHVYTLKVDQSLPSLESLCRHAIMSKIASEGEDARIHLLPLPTHEINRLTKINEPLTTVILSNLIISCVHKLYLYTVTLSDYYYNNKQFCFLPCRIIMILEELILWHVCTSLYLRIIHYTVYLNPLMTAIFFN